MSEENTLAEPVHLSPVPEKTLYLATWSSRFWAWLVDFILVILFLNIVRGILEPVWRLPLLWEFRDGTKISYVTAAIESLPKAFLNIPFIIIFFLDCLIGWLAMPDTKLRVFNRISGTIVIKTDYKEPAGILYVKEKE
jgi:hypothetical protein